MKVLEYCVNHNYLPTILETNYLIFKKIIDGIWEVPLKIVIGNKKNQSLMEHKKMVVVHTLREGNKMEELLAYKLILQVHQILTTISFMIFQLKTELLLA